MAIKPLNSVAGFSVGETPVTVADSNANIYANNLSVDGVSNLNYLSNVIILGGSNGQVIQTDGLGHLVFTNFEQWRIQNGTSNVAIATTNGNVTIGVSGNANIAVFTGNGAEINGNLAVNGSITANGNLTVDDTITTPVSKSLLISPSTEYTVVASNVNPSSDETYDLGNLAYRWNNLYSYGANIFGNANVGNIGGNNAVFTYLTGTLTTAAQPNITSVGTLSNLNVAGNANVGNLKSAGYVTATGNVTGGNLVTAGILSVGGNANVGNLGSAGIVTALGNITGGNLITTGLVSATGNVTGANINTTGLITATGNITGGNIISFGNISATGNVTADTFSGNFSGNMSAPGTNTSVLFNRAGNTGSSNALQFDYVSNVLTVSGRLTTTGNVEFGNVQTTGVYADTLSSTGNASVGNILTDGYYYANGQPVDFQQPAGSNTQLQFNDNNDFGASANLTFDKTTNNLSLSGNLLSNGVISTTGNITGNNLSITANAAVGNLDVTGTVSFTGDVSAGNISASGNVTTPNVRSSGSLSLIPGSGGNIDLLLDTGNLNANHRYINNVANPLEQDDVATKQYVDDAVSSGITIHTPVYVESPSTDGNRNAIYADGGTTQTVTTITGGKTLQFSSSPGLAVNDVIVFNSTTNGIVAGTAYFVSVTNGTNQIEITDIYDGESITTLTNGTGLSITSRANSGVGATLTSAVNEVFTCDSINPSVTQRVLIYNQTNGYENGVYVVTDTGSPSTPWILTRASDCDTYSPKSTYSLSSGDYFYVQAGFVGKGESYVCTAPTGTIIFGVTNIEFTQFSASQVYSAGTGLTLTGTTFSVNPSQTQVTAVGTLIGLSVSGNANIANIGTGILTATGTVTGGNLATAGTLSAGGNANTGNLNVSGLISATGNITGGNFATIGNLSAGGNATVGNIVSNGYANIGNIINLGNGVVNTTLAWHSATTASVSANQTISSINISGFCGIEYLVKGFDATGGKYSIATVQAVTDGTSADYSTFGAIQIGGVTGTLAVNVVGSYLRLQVTPSSSNSTVWTTQYRYL